MSKPIVEKYEQILAQDPASTVFVELAKALIEKGEHARAIDVCKTGLSHHKESVVGRVLWGKALINLGKPAEAMEQFDKATGIDRDNPHAYNLIGEVLLHKGLYRSALPLLKKAVALQPNDGRVRQWLEQTQRALAGGPAPVLVDVTGVDPVEPNDPSSAMTDPGLAVKKKRVRDADATEVNIPAYVPGADAGEATPSTPVPRPVLDDPFAAVAEQAPLGDTISGLTQTFNALSADVAALQAPAPSKAGNGSGKDPFAEAAKNYDGEVMKGLTETFDALDERHPTQPTVIPSQELMGEVRPAPVPEPEPPSGPAGLLDEVSSAPVDLPAAAQVSAMTPVPTGPSTSLLDDIPDAFEPASSVEVPKVEVSPQAAEAIAREYERELREKLAVAAAKKTFLQRHGIKLGIAVVSLVALVVGGGAFLYTRHKHRGRDLKTAVADAKRGIALDTRASYRLALESSKLAAEMDGASVEAWALAAYAHSILFAERGGAIDDKLAALSALARPGVREAAPGLALICEFYLADAKGREEKKKALLASTLDETEVHAAAGRALIAEKKADEGIKRLSRAIELLPANVRALVTLGDYYRDFGDFENAAKLYGVAAQHSREHPEAVLGLADARLELGREQADALKEVEALPAGEAIDPSLLPRRQLVHGRLLATVGRGDEAVKMLTEGAKQHKSLGFEFSMALGEASKSVGKMDPAQKAFEAALKARPKSDEAKEMLGRVLIARDHEKEALQRLVPEGEARKVYLVRGIAAARMGDWKRVRSELARTQVNGKFPTESVVYLALADAAEGQGEKAQEVLEKTLNAAKKSKAEVRVALGQVYRQRGALDKAKVQFEAAAKDPQDEEGACSLGRLLLQLGLPEMAIEPLTKAVAKNGSHGEARHALGRAYLARGKWAEGLAQAEAWAQDNPASAKAQADLAFALLQSGKGKEAEAASAKAVKNDANDAGAQRVRAMALFARADPKGAIAALERANKLDSKDAETFCEIGSAMVRSGNTGTALKAFEAALRGDPKGACGAIGGHLARLPMVGKGAAKELAEIATSARAQWDRAWAEATRARVLLAGGAAKDARKAAEDAIALAPAHGGAHYALGLAAQKLKDEAKAKEALARAAELEPSYGAIRLALADVLARGGPDELAKAVEEYEAVLRVGASDGDLGRARRSLPALKKRLQK